MKCELKGTVNMNLQGGETVKLTEVLYVPQAVKNILSISEHIPKGPTMGYNKEKNTTKKGGVNMTLDTRKGKMRSKCST